MNGIEKISARILADAETEAAAIRAQAGEKAAQLRADYDRRIESEQQRLTAEAQAEADKQLERDQGAARMAARRQLLETKQALVDAAFRQAEQQLLSLPTAEYMKLCAQLAARASASGSEELIFCTRGPRTGRTGRRGAGERAAPEGREGSKADAFRRNAADARRRGAEGRAGRDELLDRHNDKRPAARAFRQGCGLPVWLRPGG